MAVSIVPQGNTVTLSTGTITTGVVPVPVDPADVTLTIHRPDGTDDTYTFGQLFHSSTGVFNYTYLPSAPGKYSYRFVASGPTAVGEGVFTVTPAVFGSDAGQTFAPTGYLTLAEFKAMPTGVTVQDLIRGGSAAANDTELANILCRASAWADTYCDCVLGATVTFAERTRARAGRDGTITLSPRNVTGNIPLVALTRLAYGAGPTSMTTITSPTTWIMDGGFVVTIGGGGTSWSGALQFGNPGPGANVYVDYDYVSGYVATTITTASNAGATSLMVADRTGIVAGQPLRIHDTGAEEVVAVAASYATTTGPGTVALLSPATKPHSVAAGIGNMPEDVKLSVSQIAIALIRRSSDTGKAGGFRGGSGPSIDKEAAGSLPDYLGSACKILKSYRRAGTD